MTTKYAKAVFLLGIITFVFLWSQFYKQTSKGHEIDANVKYVLQWTLPDTIPFIHMGKGKETFMKRKCPAQNCFVTSNRTYFNDLTKFDVIVFHGPELVRTYWSLPWNRSRCQKYVFVSWESSHYYPMHDDRYENFFNWTWSFKLNSDIRLGYITIRDKHNGEVIGPNRIMNWKRSEEMLPIDANVKSKLQMKSKAAAWFVSNCESMSKREEFVKELQMELGKYSLFVDIYGGCGTMKCATEKTSDCLAMVERDYYFYLSFENSFCQDYVTEKLLHALQHYAIPVVYGSANYSSFMPEGIYLDAKKLGVQELANQMNSIIKDKERYYSFFKWNYYYSYHNPDDAPDSDSYCQFCDMLNDTGAMIQTTVYRYFKEWWNK